MAFLSMAFLSMAATGGMDAPCLQDGLKAVPYKSRVRLKPDTTMFERGNDKVVPSESQTQFCAVQTLNTWYFSNLWTTPTFASSRQVGKICHHET
jgi:hypothetical protein